VGVLALEFWRLPAAGELDRGRRQLARVGGGEAIPDRARGSVCAVDTVNPAGGQIVEEQIGNTTPHRLWSHADPPAAAALAPAWLAGSDLGRCPEIVGCYC
jgi:hypothetical protein